VEWLSDSYRLIALMFCIGALSGAGMILKNPGVFRFRLLMGWMFHGGVTALIGGLMLIYFFPSHRDDAAMAAGLAAIAAGIGTERIYSVLMALLKKKLDPESKVLLSELIQHSENTLDMTHRMDITGEFSQAEIRAAVAEYKAKKAKNEPPSP